MESLSPDLSTFARLEPSQCTPTPGIRTLPASISLPEHHGSEVGNGLTYYLMPAFTMMFAALKSVNDCSAHPIAGKSEPV